MRIVMGGATGLIGTALSASLRQDGHDVIRLVRRAPPGRGRSSGIRAARWTRRC